MILNYLKYLTDKNNKIKFKGTLTFITADNLTVHNIGAFYPFHAHRPCRKCITTKEERKFVLHEDDCSMRTKNLIKGE